MNNTNKSNMNIFEDIKKAYHEGKFNGPLADIIATFIYIIAHAIFKYWIEKLILQLLDVMKEHMVNIVI